MALANVHRLALRDALGLPACVLLATMIGFGSLARESGLSLAMSLTATLGIWGLPGQVALAELYAGGAASTAIVVAVAVANARFLPMAMSLMPMMRTPDRSSSHLFASVQLLSINSWAAASREFPGIERPARHRYFLVFSLVCMGSGLIGTAIGFFLVESLPQPIALGMILMNPIFFALVFASSRGRSTVLALTLGAILGPVAHLVSPSWGVLATGLFAGSLAYLLARGARLES